MNKPRKEGGDELICNGNYIKVAQIGIEKKRKEEATMAKILELQKRISTTKERTVGSIEIKNQTETTADLCFLEILTARV